MFQIFVIVHHELDIKKGIFPTLIFKRYRTPSISPLFDQGLKPMKLFKNGVIITMLMAIAVAKNVDNVFRSVSLVSASSPGRPMDGHTVDIGWVLDHNEVGTGDIFTLDMPHAFYAYPISTGQSPFFYLNTTDGTSVASCEIDAGAGFSVSNGTTITCVVIADFCLQALYSGTQRFGVKLASGGRIETIPAATQWTTGINTVTFNGNLSYDITFTEFSSSEEQYYQLGNGLTPDRYFLYFFIYDPCAGPSASGYGGAFTSATMTITVQGQTVLQNALTEMYYSDMSSFLFPLDYNSIVTSKVLSSDQKTITFNMGPAPALSKLWFSTYVKSLLSSPGFPSFTFSYSGHFKCSDGTTAERAASYPMYGNTPLLCK
jgi:hypothetical protein